MARMTINTLFTLVNERFEAMSTIVNDLIDHVKDKVRAIETTTTNLKKENAQLRTEIDRLNKFKQEVARRVRLQEERRALAGEELEQFLTERGLPLDKVTQALIVVEDRDDRNWRVWVRYDVYKANTTQAQDLLAYIRTHAAWTTRAITMWDDFGNGYVLISKKLKKAAPPEPEPEEEQTTKDEVDDLDDLENVNF